MAVNKKKPKHTKAPVVTKEDQENNAMLYATYTIMYLNDCVANCALDVARAVKSAGFKSNAPAKICRGLNNRANEYFKRFNTTFGQAIDNIAAFNCEYDEKCDSPLIDFRNYIKEELVANNAQYADFVALVETCRTVAEYACDMNDHMIEQIKPVTSRITSLSAWKPTEIRDVCYDLSNLVIPLARLPKSIDLNTNEKVVDRFVEWNKCIFEYSNFKRAYKKASKEFSE